MVPMNELILPLTTNAETGIIIPILQMKKLGQKHRDIK